MSDAKPTAPAQPARPLPPQSVAGAPFWDASREQRLVLPWCRDCEQPHWYPRGFCPRCLGPDIEWREASGRGTVHAVSVQPGDRPAAVALVDLEEGVRMMARVVDVEADSVVVGLAVTIRWKALDDGRHLAWFTPAG